MWGLVTAWFYFFFRSNHLRSIVKISSTRMPETIPANTDRRKEYADNILAEIEETISSLRSNVEAAQATINSAIVTIKNNRKELK